MRVRQKQIFDFADFRADLREYVIGETGVVPVGFHGTNSFIKKQETTKELRSMPANRAAHRMPRIGLGYSFFISSAAMLFTSLSRQ
jgi:hypothetical protein